MKQLLSIIFLFYAAFACAQFKVVDAKTHEPIAGAYIFDNTGKLLEVTGANGMVAKHTGLVSISMLSYESAKVDALTQKDDVELIDKPFDLGEVVVTPLEYIKTSGVFRDVFRNDGKLTIYREGIVDFYYNTKTKEYTRRVRACRQYTDKRLDKLFDFSIYLGPYASFDMRRLQYVDADSISEEHGDTTVFSVKGGTNDAIIRIVNKEKGIYRSIIDGIKSKIAASTIIHKYKSCIFDWTYRDANKSLANIKSFSSYIQMDCLLATKGFKAVEVTMRNEFVVTDIHSLSKEDAKREMKNKKRVSVFVMPDILPALNFDLEAETRELKPTDFCEYK